MLVGRLWLGIDIRQHGSGNIGMTNVMRAGGKGPGAVTFLLDFAKGAVAVVIARFGLSESGMELPELFTHYTLIGVVAVLGHVHSVFLGFKGGKGISTLFGVLAVLDFRVGLLVALIWVAVFIAKKISSLSSLVMLGCLPFMFVLVSGVSGQGINWTQTGLMLFLSLWLIYQHRQNIRRLLNGTEGTLKVQGKR
ncbi:MAG: glycerol-3-phosphate acyltransferase [SAR324 cluster bacterium]|nr:glycerol-3-phosphate acyltransferase [SAR324 cluster bacterium]